MTHSLKHRGPSLDEVEAQEHYDATRNANKVRWCAVPGCVRPVRSNVRRCPQHGFRQCERCQAQFRQPQGKLYRFCLTCRQEQRRISRGGALG